MKIIFLLFFLFSANLYSFSNIEVEVLKLCFSINVQDNIQVDSQYEKNIYQDARIKLAQREINTNQYFLYVDRNKQLVFILFFDSFFGITKIGTDKVSTGNPKKPGCYITPVGIFENTIDNFGYRALGTKNSKGWRGLGKKGSRVWDFGWQTTWDHRKKREREIRLLLHATDPDYGEPRLGKPNSQGCVRISAKLNEFLDKFGILDKNYEASEKKDVRWLLSKKRMPVHYAGSFLLIGDSTFFDSQLK